MYLHISTENDPAWHAALEEYLVRHLPHGLELVLLYVNRPAVVIGKNQNPWRECAVEWIEREGMALIRRISGGGTVVHDAGNLNFAFITGRDIRQVNNYRPFLQPLIAFLRTLGLEARQNEHNDIVVGDKKISGNAQFTSRGRMISHGTLLFNSDLSRLKRALQTTAVSIKSHSRPSRRSPVGNIREMLPAPMEMSAFREGLINHLRRHFAIREEWALSEQDRQGVADLCRERYQSDAWRYGRTPRFTLETPASGGPWRITVSGGKIEKITSGQPSVPGEYLDALTGTVYRQGAIKEKLSGIVEFEKIKPYTLSRFIKIIYPFYEE